MDVYYNENDPAAVEWLRALIAANAIAPGDVDTRSISDVRPDDLAGYAQCHFFAGIGGWSRALRLAGIPDDYPVWTGSCPCQPFSNAGRRGGQADERHLWPHWFHLIDICRPSTVFGEQVASKDGLDWLDLVSADLEGAGYAFAAADLCAAGVGSPHIRQRLYFVGLADAHGGIAGQTGTIQPSGQHGCESQNGGTGGMEHATGFGREQRWPEPGGRGVASGCGTGGLAHAFSAGRRQTRREPQGNRETDAGRARNRNGHGSANVLPGWVDPASRPSPVNGFWRDADWLGCTDGRWRPVKSDTFPLAHGIPGRVGLLRGYGNAIVPQVAQAFIEAVIYE